MTSAAEKYREKMNLVVFEPLGLERSWELSTYCARSAATTCGRRSCARSRRVSRSSMR